MADGGQGLHRSREREGYDSAILHILVVGFHHQKGSTVEFAYPPLGGADSPETRSVTGFLPHPWRYLPHIALPDGCHNYEEDAVFFTLPHPSDSNQSVYGVACCRQTDAQDVQGRSEDITRSTIQKSICVLSHFPVFGFIEAKLNLVTHAYFNAKDFSDVSILEEAYESLNASITSQLALKMTGVGLSQQDQVLIYHHRLLQLFKALLLQKRVVVLGSPVRRLCTSVLAVASLLPSSLTSLVDPNCDQQDEYGLPLRVFTQNTSLQPYLCLQQMDALMDKKSGYLLSGVVNPLYEKQQKKICDVFVQLDGGSITVHEQELKSILHLTAADLRFCSVLSNAICDETDIAAQWYGSNEWVQAQFKLYLLSLLATTTSTHTLAMDDFNPEFVVSWLRSPVYRAWLETRHDGLTRVEPRHICAGELSIGDLKRRLLAQARDYGVHLQSREQVVHVVQETKRVVSESAGRMSSAVGNVWGRASTALSSWWWRGGQTRVKSQDSQEK